MTKKHLAILLLILYSAFSIAVYAQSQRDNNARTLKPYFSPRVISVLEWELLQFNLLWQGSFDGSVNYVTSYPVLFDVKSMRFRATFAVQEKRDFNDPNIFFKLPRAQRESILQGAIDQLTVLLEQSFPQVKNNPSLLYAEFWFRSSGGGRSVIAKLENGTFSMSE